MRRMLYLGAALAFACVILHFFHPWADTYTYYCPEIDFTFQMREEIGSSVLIFYTDSLTLPQRKGSYSGLEFYVLDSCNIIFFKREDSVCIKKIVLNKYDIKYLTRDRRFSLDLSPLGDSYWEFCGKSDQGHHTFSYSYKGMNYQWHLLKPKEWE